MYDAVVRAGQLADHVLFPIATQTELSKLPIPRAVLRALAETSLFGVYVPCRDGGLELAESQVRDIYAALAGGCASTAFVWMQHQSLVRKLIVTQNAELAGSLLPSLARGDKIAGDVNYLRRTPPAITAVPVTGGYLLRGEAPWVASWGIANVYIVAAVDQTVGDALYFCVPAGSPGMRAQASLGILAVSAASCVRLRIDDVRVTDSQLVERLSWSSWRDRDIRRTAQPMPPVFGIADRAIRLLHDLAEQGQCDSSDATAQLADELASCRRRSWELADDYEAGTPVPVADQLAARAWSHELALRITGALLARGGGRSVQSNSDAQRLLREAAFFSIQSQSGPVRAATLSRFAGGPAQPTNLMLAAAGQVTRRQAEMS
jgi:alkylation response protein AidB-like acyl-CoA dehydrogenase